MGVWYRAQTPGREPRHAAAGERRPVCALGGMDRPTRCPRAFVTPPASLLTQTLADPRAGLSVNPCVGHGWGLAGARHWGAAKEGGLVGMDTEVCYGDSGGARFPTPNTPCPVQCPTRGAMGACVGQWGCAGAGTGHRLEP